MSTETIIKILVLSFLTLVSSHGLLNGIIIGRIDHQYDLSEDPVLWGPKNSNLYDGWRARRLGIILFLIGFIPLLLIIKNEHLSIIEIGTSIFLGILIPVISFVREVRKSV